MRGWSRSRTNLPHQLFAREAILTCARRSAAYPLSLRSLEEMMPERGVFVVHATVHRWALKILPWLAKVFR